MLKYLVIDEREHDIFTTVCDTLEDANREALDQFERLTTREKANSHIYVLDVKDTDLEDPEDWDSFTAGGYCDGRFDSYHEYTVALHHYAEGSGYTHSEDFDHTFCDSAEQWYKDYTSDNERIDGCFNVELIDADGDIASEFFVRNRRLSDGYLTHDGEDIINATAFDYQWYDSVDAAYKQCVAHDVECLKAGGAVIDEVYEDRIWYTMDGRELWDEVILYDEAGERVPWTEV